jgi:hypothetical protein
MNAISRMAHVTNAPVRLPDTVKSLSKIRRNWSVGVRSGERFLRDGSRKVKSA